MRKYFEFSRVTAGILLVILIAGMAAGYALLSGAVWPEATGDKRLKDSSLTVDASNADQGYIMVKGPEGSKKMKARVTKGEVTLTYDVNSKGDYEVFPLQLGSGKYTCSLYKNVKGNKYASAGKVSFSVELVSEGAPFLCPNQYVRYTPETQAALKSVELCEGLTTDREKFEAIRNYIKTNYVYDFVKATTVKPGAMPDIDGCFETRMGICQDLAAVAACMLRVQGIPTQLVIGYANKNYHAWNSVLLDGEAVHFDPTVEVNAIPGNVTYTVERYY